MRIAAAVFVAMHGLGHVIWFMVTWTRRALGEQGRAEVDAHRHGFFIAPETGVGKMLGALSLLALFGFVAAGWGIWMEASWWPALLIASVAASVIVVLAMWNPIKHMSVRALLADVALVAATFMPWGERLLGAR